MKNSKEAVKEFIEASEETHELPERISGSLEYEYNVSMQEFFKEFRAINMAALAKKVRLTPVYYGNMQ